MSVNLISVKCPDCGANLNIEEGREQAFCTYCGAKVLIHNENEHIYRHIDEAEVKQAETDYMVKMKKLELAEKIRSDAKRSRIFFIVLSIVMGIAGGLMIIIGFMGGNESGDKISELYMLLIVGFLAIFGAVGIWSYVKKKYDDVDDSIDIGDMAKVPESISDYEKKSYTAIKTLLVNAGFTNISCVALNDLTLGLIIKPGFVESITINGRAVTSGGKKYPKDAAVVISYHSLNR